MDCARKLSAAGYEVFSMDKNLSGKNLLKKWMYERVGQRKFRVDPLLPPTKRNNPGDTQEKGEKMSKEREIDTAIFKTIL